MGATWNVNSASILSRDIDFGDAHLLRYLGQCSEGKREILSDSSPAMIIKSRWRYSTLSRSTPAFLDALEIEYRKVKGETFWEANRAQIPELYRELQSEARERIRSLHPDNGGNGREFGLFIQALNAAKKTFAWNCSRLLDEPQQIELPRARPGKQTGGFCKIEEVKSALKLLQAGKGIRETSRLTGLSQTTLRKARKHLIGVVIQGCECGRPALHKGYWCKPRFERSSRRREVFGKMQDSLTRRNVSQGRAPLPARESNGRFKA